METKKIAVLAGDGIGPEVMNEALKVLEKVAEKFSLSFEFKKGLVGGAAWETHQNHFPEETRNLIEWSDAVLFGSVGGPVSAQLEPKWKDCERNSILAVRKFMNLSINLRPAPIFSELLDFCPLKKEIVGEKAFEILVIRELSEDIYFGEHKRSTADEATDEAFYNRSTIEAFAEFSFGTAQKRQKKMTSVDKANVLETSRLWREVFEETAKKFPDVEFRSAYVDNLVQQLVKNPRNFDVLACPNLFGDIVSDLTAVFPGSLGMLPSASLGEKKHLYEPSGGSAPDIAGKNLANPIAQILSAAMMLRYSFGEELAAQKIEKAVENVIAKGGRTGDIFGGNQGETKLSCSEMGDRIIKRIS